jgi:beta-galactosidase
LNGRDSKIHVTDYDIAGINMIYSSAEVFTWAKGVGSSRVLILYGGEGETHEAAFPSGTGKPQLIEGFGVSIVQKESSWVLQWQVTTSRKVVKIDDLHLYLVWRNEAYNHWVLELPAADPVGNFTSLSKERVIVSAGYLIRSAKIMDDNLALTGDVNVTTMLEVLSAPAAVNSLTFNGFPLPTSKTQVGNLAAMVHYSPPNIQIPNLSQLQWKIVDSLPEIQPSFNDAPYRALAHTSSNNPRNLSTPKSLYAMDYGYHAGSFIYRGHFTANSLETTTWLNVSGGVGFGHSIWLNQTFLGSWPGAVGIQNFIHNLTFPSKLEPGKPYVLTVLIDHMGYDEEAPGTDAIKFPRGILNYSLSGHSQADIEWRMTGNLGGEQYVDLTRGPLNEGSMYAERQGYHLPCPPDTDWKSVSPVQNGIGKAGVGFFTTSFDLNILTGWDVPMSIVFNTSSTGTLHDWNSATQWGSNYRCQLFVNGYQFGKYGKFLVRLHVNHRLHDQFSEQSRSTTNVPYP